MSDAVKNVDGSGSETLSVRPKIAPPGSMEGEFWMAEDFDEPLDDLFDCLQDNSDDLLDQA